MHSPGLAPAVFKQLGGHFAPAESPPQAAEVLVGAPQYHALVVECEFDLSPRMQTGTFSQILGDHNLALSTHAMSHTEQV
jgi:hypothetical protein